MKLRLPDELFQLTESSEGRDALATRESARRLGDMLHSVSTLASNLASEIESLAAENDREALMQRTEKDSGRPYSIEEAAAKAGLDDKTVRRAIQQGQVLAVRGGQGRLTTRAGSSIAGTRALRPERCSTQVKDVLAEYAEQLPLTLRQIFYRMVGAYGYEKTEQAYERLGETLNKARRARVIGMDAIRDDGFTSAVPVSFLDEK